MKPLYRFYVAEEITDINTQITGSEAHHIVKVLRKGKGEKVILFDGKGTEYLARIDTTSKDAVDVTILSKSHTDREEHVSVSLCVAVPKGERMDQLIRSCSELGVRRILPLTSRRTVVKGGEGGSAKLERWRRIAVEASKQSGRVSVCEVSPAGPLSAAIEQIDLHSVALFGAPQEGVPFIGEVLSVAPPDISSVVLYIGPEGGFTRQERASMERAGAVAVGIGKTVLRVETAAAAMTAMVLFGTHAT